MWRRGLALASIALLVAGTFAGLSPAASAKGGTKTFKGSSIPFTFRYPSTFRRGTVKGIGIKNRLPAVGLDTLDLIIIRKAGVRIPNAELKRFVRDLLKRLHAKPASLRAEKHSGLRMIVARVPNEVDHKPTVSVLYFFGGAGTTWEIECQSTVERRVALTYGCGLAINTLRFP